MAVPAALGLRLLVKYWREPEDDTLEGRCGGLVEFGGGEQRSQRRKSISWHDFVRRDGAALVVLRQFPLYIISNIILSRYWLYHKTNKRT